MEFYLNAGAWFCSKKKSPQANLAAASECTLRGAVGSMGFFWKKQSGKPVEMAESHGWECLLYQGVQDFFQQTGTLPITGMAPPKSVSGNWCVLFESLRNSALPFPEGDF